MSHLSDANTRVEATLRSAGLRRTPATLALARLFMEAGDVMLPHAKIEQAIKAQGLTVNRVTVYRLLDRFVTAGLLSRTVDAQRVSRFALATLEGKSVPHFECDDCHRQFRLADSSKKIDSAARQMLKVLGASGHAVHSIDVSIHGRCAGCTTGTQSGNFS